MIDYPKELNEQQLEAVTAPPGPLLIIAGAGSGKTRTLTYRVAYLIEKGLPPDRLLLLTFTNKAATEMLHRVCSLLPVDSSRICGGTFHSICNRLLRRHAREAGYEPGFSILDEEDSKEVVSQSVAELKIDTKKSRFPKPDVLGDIFSLAVNTESPLEQVIRERYEHFEELIGEIKRVEQRYQSRKKELNGMDYDDLLLVFLRLLRTNAEVRERYQKVFQYVLVDEYQDTNKIQSDIIDTLVAGHKNVMVVGDDAQSIYSWRGANFRNIMDFPKRYSGARIIRIEQNYRSTPQVLELANASIAQNTEQFKKNLHSVRARGPKPVIAPASNASAQAEFVVSQILELQEQGIDLNQMAVLYRSHYHSMELQMELTRRNIAFHITSGIRFFEQAHVKDVAAHLRLALNPNDELSFKRLLKLMPKIGAATADKIWRRIACEPRNADLKGLIARMSTASVPAAAQNEWRKFAAILKELDSPDIQKNPPEMIRSVLESWYAGYLKVAYPNYAHRLEDLGQLAVFAAKFKDLESFLAELTLMTNMEIEQEKREADLDPADILRLSSVHQAKGLEFQAVFVIWLADGMFPSSRSLETQANEEEERRLFYVAVTRAKDHLFLIYPLIRSNAGYYGDIFQKPSRFLAELPEHCAEKAEVPEAGYAW